MSKSGLNINSSFQVFLVVSFIKIWSSFLPFYAGKKNCIDNHNAFQMIFTALVPNAIESLNRNVHNKDRALKQLCRWYMSNSPMVMLPMIRVQSTYCFLYSNLTDVTLFSVYVHVSTHLDVLSASSKSFRSILYAALLAKIDHLNHCIDAYFRINKVLLNTYHN